MKKNLFCFLLLSLILSSVFATELSGRYSSEDGSITFQESSYSYSVLDMMTGIQQTTSGDYETTKDEYGNKILILHNFMNKDLLLRYFVFDDFLFLYNQTNRPWFRGSNKSSRRLERLVSTKITATSFLIEGDRKYIPDQLSYWGNLDYVWSEGNIESGVGDKLFIERKAINTLYILPGFVSISRPDLYGKNNRPKKIKITAGNYEKEFTLKDEPVFQAIQIEVPDTEKTIILEITDIYKGSRYNDTCISAILCLI